VGARRTLTEIGTPKSHPRRGAADAPSGHESRYLPPAMDKRSERAVVILVGALAALIAIGHAVASLFEAAGF